MEFWNYFNRELVNKFSKRKINIAENAIIIASTPLAEKVAKCLISGHYCSDFNSMFLMRYFNDVNILYKIYELFYGIITEEEFREEQYKWYCEDMKYWCDKEYTRAVTPSRLLEYHKL